MFQAQKFRKFFLMKKITNENHRTCVDVHVLDLFQFSGPTFSCSFDASMCNRSINVITNM